MKPPICNIKADIQPIDKNGASGKPISGLFSWEQHLSRDIPYRAAQYIKLVVNPIIAAIIAGSNPRTKPAPAINLMSPPPIRPLHIMAVSKKGKAITIPADFMGSNEMNPVSAIRILIRSGISRLFISMTDAVVNNARSNKPLNNGTHIVVPPHKFISK
jgi:hypothetical protein